MVWHPLETHRFTVWWKLGWPGRCRVETVPLSGHPTTSLRHVCSVYIVSVIDIISTGIGTFSQKPNFSWTFNHFRWFCLAYTVCQILSTRLACWVFAVGAEWNVSIKLLIKLRSNAVSVCRWVCFLVEQRTSQLGFEAPLERTASVPVCMTWGWQHGLPISLCTSRVLLF